MYLPTYMHEDLKWGEVNREPSLSDHRHILFNIKSDIPDNYEYRDPRRTNWDTYEVELRQGISEIGMNTLDLMEFNLRLTDTILKSYNKSCPISRTSANRRNP